MHRRLYLPLISIMPALLLPGCILDDPATIPPPVPFCSAATTVYGTPTQASGPVELTFCFSDVETEANLGISGDTRELAVAFHSLTFINQAGEPIGDPILFGTAAANALQTNSDWFENESISEPGVFQWAGDALSNDSNTATLQLDIPPVTEGILLNITSIVDEIWMEVLVNGVPAANLRVDSYWHSGYVPIGMPTPELRPPAAPSWASGRYFPRFPESGRVYAIKVRAPLWDQPWSWQQDWEILDSGTPVMSQTREHHETAMALTLAGMQGIINRSGPRVYLIWEDPSKYR